MSRSPLSSLPVLAVALSLAACTGASTRPDAGAIPPDAGPDGGTPDGGTPDGGTPDGGTVARGPGLHYDGAVAVKRATAASSTGWELVEVSAPLLPYYLGAAVDIEGPNYPKDQAARVDYVLHDTFTFAALLDRCALLYPGIVSQQPGGLAPTPAQLAANYALVAQCAYEKFTVKPYWIPQLVDDVDVCAVTLGAPWRLIEEQDLDTLDAADLKNIQDTLSGVGTNFWGEFYFSLRTFLRGKDGTLKAGDLTPGVATRVSALSYPMGSGPTRHYEGALVPRCIWRHPVAN